jgi:hypothetical protein
MLPDFVGVGAHRSGTTWIYEMLKSHPQVCMSPEKELNFFNQSYQKGVQWYESFFSKCNKNLTVGEFSPAYLADNRVPERMKALIPEVKLIISVRNPINQIYSRYCYMVSRQLYDKSFDCALKDGSYLIEQAYYYQHINRFLNFFERSQILILIYEDLERNPLSFLNQIYTFLGINNSYVPPNYIKRVHSTRMPRNRYLEASVVAIRKGLKGLQLFFLIEQIKKRRIAEKIRALNTKRTTTFSDMDPTTRLRLNAIFKDENKMLSDFLGRDLSYWC